MSSYSGERSKSRTTIVKPILRKLTQSEKNSLDLDRPAEQQDGLGIYDFGNASRSSHDVVFIPGRRGYHNRSTSGTSQFSTATAGSGHRAGSFVHPFAQTPRPYTPPLGASSYQNSVRESDPAESPGLTDDGEDVLVPGGGPRYIRSPSALSNYRSPSLTNATTSPIIITQQQQPLRVQTKLSSSRLALATSHTSTTSSTTHINHISSNDLLLTSPTDSLAMSPTSAIRDSFDKGFRLRSRSEAANHDTTSGPLARSEQIAEARRKFMEKEREKDEKAARKEIREREKLDQKVAARIERHHRRSSASEQARGGGGPGIMEGSGGRKILSNNSRSRSDLTITREKGGGNDGFVGRQYSAAAPVNEEDDALASFPRDTHPRRGSAAKRKTHSAWTKFVMWLRTRFLRINSSKKKKKGGRL